MSEKTNIAWTDSTINFWSGCTMVKINGGLKESGCLHCYAKDRDDRQLQEPVSHWGKGAPRLKSKGAVKDAFAFNRRPWICDGCGFASNHHDTNICGNVGKLEDETPFHCMCRTQHRRRIFSLSLGDWLDDEVPIEWLAEMLDTIRQCQDVDWILCTKRPENFFTRLQKVFNEVTLSPKTAVWLSQWHAGLNIPTNIILLASVENQAAADLRIPQLIKIPSACHGLSLEPLLGEVQLTKIGHDYEYTDALRGQHRQFNSDGQCRETKCKKLDWLIIGGESGASARPCNVEWIRSLVAQGKAAGVPTFVKQLGAKPIFKPVHAETLVRTSRCEVVIRDKKGGDITEWANDLRVREFYLATHPVPAQAAGS